MLALGREGRQRRQVRERTAQRHPPADEPQEQRRALAWQLRPAILDDDAATAESLAADACLQFAFDAPLDAGFYTLTVGDAPQAALGWTLEGRTGADGDWVELDRRTDESFQWAHQLRPFRIARPAAYREYRLRLQAGAPLALAEFELLREGEPTPPRAQATPGS